MQVPWCMQCMYVWMAMAYTTRKGFAYPLFMVCNAGLYKAFKVMNGNEMAS